MPQAEAVVIVGAGQAGFQTAISLRTAGFTGQVTLIGDEPDAPYNRPPLSKNFLLGKEVAEDLAFRPTSFYEQHGIVLRMGLRAVEIDCNRARLRLDSGEHLPYDWLVLATGARVRTMTADPIDGLLYLRTLADARECKRRLEATETLVIIGAGFIGLEVAAAAAALGKRVTVAALEDRPMSRVVSPGISAYFRSLHEVHGVRLMLGEAVASVERGVCIHLASKQTLQSNLVIAGIGVIPNVELATGCGLAIANGIRVDEYLCTSDPRILAIGDCADHPNRFFVDGRSRLESIQNSVDQARCAAASIAGQPKPYSAVPWFWSDQFDAKLQIAGVPSMCDEFSVRGEPWASSFSVYGFRHSALTAVESVNRPVDHIQARRLLELGVGLRPDQAADPTFDLKSLTHARSH